MEKNLIIDLNNSVSVINSDIVDSNEKYNEGYIPYFARRRIDFHEGEKFEIVNDFSVNLECSILRNYGYRKYTSREHIHSLLEYAFSKGTLITPDVIEDPDSVIRDGEIYNQARMAWECAKYYIHNIFMDKILFSQNVEKTKKLIKQFIFWNDLENFILATLKLKHDPEISEVFAHILCKISILRIRDLIKEDYIERMITYIFINSKYGELEEDCLRVLHVRYGEYIARLAAGFTLIEAGMINTEYLLTSDIEPHAYQMIAHGHQVFKHDNEYRFPDIKEDGKFIQRIFDQMPNKEITNPKTRRYILSSLLASQRIRRHIYGMEPPETLLGAESKVSLEEENKMITFGLWIQFNKTELPDFVKPEWINEENELFSKSVAVALLNPKEYAIAFGYTFTNWYFEVIERFLELSTQKFEKYKMEQISLEFIWQQDFIQILLAMINNLDSLNRYVKVRFLWKLHNLFNKLILDKKYGVFIPAVIKLIIVAKIHPFKNIILDAILITGCAPVDDIVKTANFFKNIDWFEKHYGSEFVVIPDESLTNQKFIERPMLELMDRMLTKEQMKIYPFTPETMKGNEDFFVKYIDPCNIDKYIFAYGLNWVEEHTKISISDLVNSNSYVSMNVVKRYLDIILLDNDLRKKCLSNKAITDYFVRDLYSSKDNILGEILKSNNFPNSVKCEVFAFTYINSDSRKLTEFLGKNIWRILPGGGNSARMLISTIGMKLDPDNDSAEYETFFTKEDLKKMISSPILDIE